MNVPDVAPAGIVIVMLAPGADAAVSFTVATFGLELVIVTVTPPAGAAHSSVTTPLDAPPPSTDVGLRVRDDRRTARTVNVSVALTLPSKAVTVPSSAAPTPNVATANACSLAPAGTLNTSGA